MGLANTRVVYHVICLNEEEKKHVLRIFAVPLEPMKTVVIPTSIRLECDYKQIHIVNRDHSSPYFYTHL